MRMLLIFGVLAALAGCASGNGIDLSAEGKATSLANVTTVNLFTPSLPGEEGELFNALLEKKLRGRLGSFLHPGARWTLTVVDIEYTTPHYKQETQHYKLMLEADLVDMDGKRGSPIIIWTPEHVAQEGWTEPQIRELLVDAVIEALVPKLPLGTR